MTEKHDTERIYEIASVLLPEEIAALEAAARDDGVSAVEWVRGAVLLALVLAVARGGH